MIINPAVWEDNDLYECNGVIANYLIYTHKLSVFGMDRESNKFYFVKNDNLKEALDKMPFYYNLINKILK